MELQVRQQQYKQTTTLIVQLSESILFSKNIKLIQNIFPGKSEQLQKKMYYTFFFGYVCSAIRIFIVYTLYS